MATQTYRENRAGEIAAMHAESIAGKLFNLVVPQTVATVEAAVAYPQ